MYKLDNDFLQSLGLGSLPVEEKNRLLQMIYERLEMNVGMRLAEKMTDQQLDEFESFIDRDDEAGALKWLESNFPNYKGVVAEELEKLKAEVTAAAPQILAAQNAAGGQPPMSGQPPVMPVAAPVNSQVPTQPQQPQEPQYQQPQQPYYAQQPVAPAQPQQPGYVPYPQSPILPPQPNFSQNPLPQQPVQPAAEPQQPQQKQFTPPPPGFMPGQ